jgi:hypothetical protein
MERDQRPQRKALNIKVTEIHMSAQTAHKPRNYFLKLGTIIYTYVNNLAEKYVYF